MNILAIGNSFSVDATRYLHWIAAADKVELETVNLYIPGCPLERHYRNMLSGERAYDLHYNGQVTGFKVSMEEALLSRKWDVITLQQQSVSSPYWDTFEPYITALYDYVKECSPKAKILLHQTWGLGNGSERLAATEFESYDDMFAEIEKNYDRCKDILAVDGIIPSGRLVADMLHSGIEQMHRDGLHVTKGFGRYALGLLWYRMLTGNTVTQNTFCDFEEPIPEGQIQLIKGYVDSLTPIL